MHYVLLLITLFGTQTLANPYRGFGEGFSTKAGTEITLKNLPPVLSQDSLGLCYSYTAAVVLNYTNCKVQNENNQRKNKPERIDCTKLPDSDAFSPLALARYSKETNENFRGISEGGSPSAILEWIAVHGENGVPSEACMSLDKVLAKVGGAQGHELPQQKKLFQDLKQRYDKYHTDIVKDRIKRLRPSQEDLIEKQVNDRKSDPNAPCVVCDFFSSLSNDEKLAGQIELSKDNTRLLRAFGEETYEKFFDRIISPPECARAKNQAFFEAGDQVFAIHSFPENKSLEKDRNRYSKTVAQIKKVLATGAMPLIGGICIGEQVNGKCSVMHSAAITGMKTLCDGAGNCHEAIRLQNSYGKSWQDVYNGGWVLAKDLLDSTGYEEQTISWLSHKTRN